MKPSEVAVAIERFAPIGCEGINLDGFLDPEDLWEFWKVSHSARPIQMARALFPSRPRGYVAVTRDLGCYASNKAMAMKCRLEGKISAALVYEDICESIYNRLPQWARW